jgi:hypothetical protein
MNPHSVQYGLPDSKILAVWEDGRHRSPVERALAMLRHALPEEAQSPVDEWSIGRCDSYLLSVHAATFGQHVTGVATCPSCDEQLDVAFSVDDVRCPHGDSGQVFELIAAEPNLHILYRLPSSADLLAVVSLPTVEVARRVLSERCILEVRSDREPVSSASLPDEIILDLSEAMAARDPQGDIRLDLTCPMCEHAWQTTFDIADFLWREVAPRARQTVMDVHVLALAYGWSEIEILAMPDARRKAYLDLVLG